MTNTRKTFESPFHRPETFLKPPFRSRNAPLGAGNIVVDDIRLRGLFLKRRGHGAPIDRKEFKKRNCFGGKTRKGGMCLLCLQFQDKS